MHNAQRALPWLSESVSKSGFCLFRWLDAHTRRLVEETLNLTGELTFTVRDACCHCLTPQTFLPALPQHSEHGVFCAPRRSGMRLAAGCSRVVALCSAVWM